MTLDLADLAVSGISAAQLVCTSEGTDTLTLTVAGPVDSFALVAPFEQLTLMDGSDQRFIGWCDQAPRAATGSAQSHSYQIVGPMRWLDRVYWATPETGGRALLATVTSMYVMAPLDTSIRAILDKVIADTAGAIAYVDADLDIAALQHHVPPEIRWDSQCGALLRRALGYAPTVLFWWDYSGAVPTIRFADADKSTADKMLSETGYSLSQASLNPRYDMLRDRVIIYWLQDNALARTDDVSATSGDAFDLAVNRSLIQTYELGPYNLPAAGIGAALLKYHSRLHTDAAGEMLGLDWSHRPGQLWSFGGLLSAGSNSFCTQVARALDRQTQSITLGVPPAFGIFKLTAAASASQPQDPKKTATVTRTILDPNDAAVTGAQFYIGTQIAPSGSSMTIAPGTYTINYIVPPDYIPPASEEITLAKDGADTATATATFRNRLRLRAADGSGTEEVDINVDDLADGAGAAKFVLNERCDGKQAWFLQTPWTTPA
ncbi:MAG: hypothetical protein ACOYM3_24350 [Terrimicrobiaceae bacterium]